MTEKLVIISDMWGSKQGLWITSYLGYLQQYYDIEYFDSQHLANLDVVINTKENVLEEFKNGGAERAAAHLVKRKKDTCHYLAFGVGGAIVWKAALMGLPVESMYLVSPSLVRFENSKPATEISILCGENDSHALCQKWAKQIDVEVQTMKNFGYSLYSDEVVIQKICLDLLQNITKINAPTQRKVV